MGARERERRFLVIVERVVHLVLSLITRRKCSLCRQRFTLYPPFALLLIPVPDRGFYRLVRTPGRRPVV